MTCSIRGRVARETESIFESPYLACCKRYGTSGRLVLLTQALAILLSSRPKFTFPIVRDFTSCSSRRLMRANVSHPYGLHLFQS